MKRNILTLLTILYSVISMAATGVILESKGKATAYSDLSLAVNAAVDGDVIYLAEGSTYTCPDGITISRLIQLRGDGTPIIEGDISISIAGMPEMKRPVIEGIQIYGKVTVTHTVTNFVLRHCKCSTLQFTAPMPGGLIDRCYVSNEFHIPPVSDGFYVRNSKIYRLKSTSTDNNSSTFVNCNIYTIYCETVAGTFINSLINEGYDYENYNLKNSVLVRCGYHYDIFRTDYDTVREIYCYGESTDCVIMNGNCDTDSNINWKGDDNTPMGIYGGDNPFTFVPTVMPKVTRLYGTSAANGIINVEVDAASHTQDNK